MGTQSETMRRRANDKRYNQMRASKHRNQFELNRVINQITPVFVARLDRMQQDMAQVRTDLTRYAEEDRNIEAEFNRLLDEVDKRIAIKRRYINEEMLKNNSRRRKNADALGLTLPPLSIKERFLEPIRDPILARQNTNRFQKQNPRKKQLHDSLLVREISRINEKSLEKLRERHWQEQQNTSNLINGNNEESDKTDDVTERILKADFPNFATKSYMLHRQSRDEASHEFKEMLKQMLSIHAQFDGKLNTYFPTSARVRASIESCVQKRVVAKSKKHYLLELQKDEEVDEPSTILYTEGVKNNDTECEKGSHPSDSSANNRNVIKAKKRDVPLSKYSTPSEHSPEKESSSLKSDEEITNDSGSLVQLPKRSEQQRQQAAASRNLMPDTNLSPIISREGSPIPPHSPPSTEAQLKASSTKKQRKSGVFAVQESILTLVGPDHKKVSVALSKEQVESLGVIIVDEFDEKTWENVQKCRYLRGHDPPEMILPEGDLTEFVFDTNKKDS